MDSAIEARCKACGVAYPLDAFPADGYGRCRACTARLPFRRRALGKAKMRVSRRVAKLESGEACPRCGAVKILVGTKRFCPSRKCRDEARVAEEVPHRSRRNPEGLPRPGLDP